MKWQVTTTTNNQSFLCVCNIPQDQVMCPMPRCVSTTNIALGHNVWKIIWAFEYYHCDNCGVTLQLSICLVVMAELWLVFWQCIKISDTVHVYTKQFLYSISIHTNNIDNIQIYKIFTLVCYHYKCIMSTCSFYIYFSST